MADEDKAKPTDDKAKPTAQERALHRRVAKAMWKVQKGKDLPKDAGSVNELWSADKNAMIAQARKVVNQLHRAGIVLAIDKSAAVDADEEEEVD